MSDPAHWRQTVAEVRALRQAGDFAAAIPLARALAQARPQDIALLADLASLLWNAGQIDAAEAAYRGVLQRDPSHAGALAGLGQIARHRQDHAAALSFFEQAASHRPGDPLLRENIARSMLLLNRAEAALDAYQALLSESVDGASKLTDMARARILADVAAIHARAERMAEAETAYQTVIAIDPRHVRALAGLAGAARQRNDHPAALAFLERARAARPDDRRLRRDVARTLVDLDRLEEAASLLAALCDEDSANVQAATDLARVRRLQGDTEAALRLLDTAVAVEPAFLPALVEFATIARSLGDDEAALHWFSRAAETDPSDPCLLFGVAVSWSDLQRPAECEAVMARALAMPGAASNETLRLRRLEYHCRTLQLDAGLACLREFGPPQDLAAHAVPWAACLHAARGEWDDVLNLLAIRIVPGRGSKQVRATPALFEAIGRAARGRSRQAEVLGLLAQWPDAATPAGTELRDQLAEELRLLHAVRPDDPPPSAAPAAPWRAERSARLARVLSTDMPAIHATIFMCTDLHYLLGAIVALSSVLRQNRAALRHCRFCMFVSDDALSLAAPLLDRLQAAYAVKIEIIAASTLGRACTGFRADWGNFTPGHRLSDAAYYRILAALWLADQGAGTALYLDSDTSGGPGLADVLRFDLCGQPLGARPEIVTIPAIRRAARKLGLPEAAYFNSGVLLLDLAHQAAVPALCHAFDICVQSPERLSFLDQCALNVAFLGQTTALPEQFNVYVRPVSGQESLPSQAAVWHFLGHPKPWDPAYNLPQGARWLEEFYALSDILSATQLRELMAMQFKTQ